MGAILQEPCPQCGKTIEGKVIGWVTKRSVFPQFCGHCGVRLVVACSHCKARLAHLVTFCPNCRTQLYEAKPPPQVLPAAPLHEQKSKPQVPERAKRLLRKTWTGTKDLCVFFREMSRLLVWNNPLQQQVSALSAALNELDENTDGEKRAGVVETALGTVTVDAEKEWTEFTNGMWDMMQGIVLVWPGLFDKTMPNNRGRFPCLSETDGKLKRLKAQMAQAFSSRTTGIASMRPKLQQLQEFCPRFREIVTRTGLLDMVIGFAAGYFGGGLGAVGTEMWQNWRGKSDQEFLTAFGRCVDDFIESGNKVSESLESEVDGVVVQALAEYRASSERCIQGLAHMAALGLDIEPMLRELERPDKPDPEMKDLHVAVLASLREKNLIDIRAESNLKTIFGLA